ncbi:MAG: acetyl-CoA carboxylase carboxyltransferase subunit alpha [Holosporales bacterium]|jgi:acetyl-CoA carboxylase carboxyl transferase subunit alpha|nr:acetyl-CoA carboxylase carboxyltransferase subunit alpha [Holosporales bacterium]
MPSSLEFENQVLIIEKKIADLREASSIGDINVASEISRMQMKVDKLLKDIYKKLTPWQKVQVARHPDRPKFLDYIGGMFTDFIELSGDRQFADDRAIIGGFAKLDDIRCVVIGEEKGRDTESRLEHNFGMPKPEGYRKAYRLLNLADRFGLPIISFVDTSGAFPGIESEERGQAEAIAKCMEKSFQINVPFISIIIGEGGSGGAIAIATSDYVLMLEHSVYSVISPEGCASILWKDESKVDLVAEFQKLTAADLLSLGIIDGIIKEPIGGAHRNKTETISNVKTDSVSFLKKSIELPEDVRKDLRRRKFVNMGDGLRNEQR